MNGIGSPVNHWCSSLILLTQQGWQQAIIGAAGISQRRALGASVSSWELTDPAVTASVHGQ